MVQPDDVQPGPSPSFPTRRRSADSTPTPIAPPEVRIRLHDNFGVEYAQHELGVPLGTQRLLAFLALHPGPITRAFVAGSLWPDVAEDRASANLRSAIWRLGPARRAIVITTRTHIRLAEHVVVDHQEAIDAARRVLDSVDVSISDLRAQAGELLPDWYDDEWVTIERERFHLLHLHALEHACDRLTDQGRHGDAVEAGMAAVAAEPLRESAHRALIRAHLVAGNRWEAIRQYEGYKAILAHQLDLPPSEEMEALMRFVRVGRSRGASLAAASSNAS